MGEKMHRHALNRQPEVLNGESRVLETVGDQNIARRFGARDNFVGPPHKAGNGAEKIVYFSRNPDEVIAVHKREWIGGRKFPEIDLISSEERAGFIRQKCINRILSILYPGMVGRIKRVANRYGVTISERISGNEVASFNQITRRVIAQLRLRSLGLRIDRGEQNFLLHGQNNNDLTYVDNVYEDKSPEVISMRLEKAINKAKLDESLRARAMYAIEKYKKLIPSKQGGV